MTKKHDAFAGRESACPKSAQTPLAAIHGGREKAPTGQGEGLGQGLLNATSLVESEARVCPAGRSKAINIAAIVAQEVRFYLVFGVLLCCVGGLLG